MSRSRSGGTKDLSSELGFTARQVIAFVVALLATSCESAGERPVEVPETPGKEVVGTAGNEGCGIPPRVEVGESAIRSLNSGGEERTYRLFLPSEYDPSEPTPLVLNLHAASATSGHKSRSVG